MYRNYPEKMGGWPQPRTATAYIGLPRPIMSVTDGRHYDSLPTADHV